MLDIRSLAAHSSVVSWQAFWKGNIGVTGGLTSKLRENLTACTADPRNGVEAYNKDWNQDPEHKFDDTRQWQQCGWR
jgi:hypothetical protein